VPPRLRDLSVRRLATLSSRADLKKKVNWLRYLLATTSADLVDVELMHEQIAVFAQALVELESTPIQLLGRAKLVGFAKTVRTWLRLIVFIVSSRTLLFHWLNAICLKLSSMAISISVRFGQGLKDFPGKDETADRS